MTPSMGSALEDLELQRLLVVYPGSTRYTLRSKVEVMSLAQCVADWLDDEGRGILRLDIDAMCGPRSLGETGMHQVPR
jgi:hypothetical protein